MGHHYNPAKQCFDDAEYEAQYDHDRQPRCNRCGSEQVRWRQQTGKWVLFSLQPGVEHVCELKDDFGVVKE